MNKLWCFDRDKTFKINKGSIPKQWAKDVEGDKIAIGNQKLKDELDIVGRNWVINKVREGNVFPDYVKTWQDLTWGSKIEDELPLCAKMKQMERSSEYWPNDLPKHLILYAIDFLDKCHNDYGWDRIILVDDANLNFVENWESWEFYYPEHFYWEFVYEYN